MKVGDSAESQFCGEINDSRFLLARFVRKSYERYRVLEVPEGESLASQDARDAADINFLMARFARTGDIPPASRPGVFQDNTGVPDNLGDAIMLSRTTLSTASVNLGTFQEAKAKEAADKLAQDQAELAELRAAKAASDST